MIQYENDKNVEIYFLNCKEFNFALISANK